jgi:hypothetical protein
VAQRAPEDLQVLRRRVTGDGDQDDVVEQDRPPGDEADELVERVAGEDRRAAALGVQRGALRVGHRRQREEHRRDQEHERREPERVTGDHAEREVERARQRRVDDREQERRADAAPERRERPGGDLQGDPLGLRAAELGLRLVHSRRAGGARLRLRVGRARRLRSFSGVRPLLRGGTALAPAGVHVPRPRLYSR